jgi:hypothetical protein
VRYLQAYREVVDWMYADKAAVNAFADWVRIPEAIARLAPEDYYPKNNVRPAGAPTSLRAIKLVGDKLAVPSQDGVRPRHIGHLGEDLAAQAMTDLGQCGSLGVRELQPPFQLGLQDPIFSDQIFAPRQQLLVHHPRDEGQDARPIHSSSTPADSRLIASKIVASATRRGYAGRGQFPAFSTVSIF